MSGRPPFPFIVGAARSGTTLLRAMLDSHPELAIPTESHFLPDLARAKERYELPSGFDRGSFVADLTAHKRFRKWDLSAAEAIRALEGDAPTTTADAIRALYAFHATARGKARYGDKTPRYVSHIRVLAALLPEARFIHLIRDGRDVAASLMSSGWKGVSGPVGAAQFWRAAVVAGREAGGELAPDRYLEIRYEELVADPEEQLRSISSFIELDYHPRMLTYHLRAEETLGRTTSARLHQKLRLPPTGNARDFRRELPERDIRIFEGITGGLLEELGYPLSVEGTTITTRLLVTGGLARHLLWKAARRGRKALR